MTTSWITRGLAIVALLVTTSAWGQVYSPGSAVDTTPVVGYGYGGYYPGGYHSSTYEEGVLNGLGQLRRGTGAYNLATAQAAVYRQEAYAKGLQNRQQAISDYFAERKLNQEARAAERTRLTTEQYTSIAQKLAPDRLTGQQYQPSMGRLHWPAILQGEAFAAEREYLNRLFAHRDAEDVGIGSEFHSRVKRATDSLAAKLQQEVGSVSPMEYVDARNFVSSLLYEARVAPETTGLAIR